MKLVYKGISNFMGFFYYTLDPIDKNTSESIKGSFFYVNVA